MNVNLEKIEGLLALFDYREKAQELTTTKIIETIKPTLLTALCELFQCSFDDVAWNSFSIVDTSLVVVCIITYPSIDKIPELIQRISPANPEADGALKRGIRIGLPLQTVFSPTEDIHKELNRIIEQLMNKDNPAVAIEFGDVHLTEDQLLHLLIFQQQNRGRVH